MKPKFDPGYVPGEKQQALFPDVSGNSINGLEETSRRRPRPLYWFEPDTIAHGRLQKYFYENAQRLQARRP